MLQIFKQIFIIQNIIKKFLKIIFPKCFNDLVQLNLKFWLFIYLLISNDNDDYGDEAFEKVGRTPATWPTHTPNHPFNHFNFHNLIGSSL